MAVNLLYLRIVPKIKYLKEQITSSSLVVQLKLKCLPKKLTHDDIIEEK